MTAHTAAHPRRSWLVTLIGTIVVGLVAAAVTGRRASAIASSREALRSSLAETRVSSSVVYEGPQAEVERLAATHGVQGERSGWPRVPSLRAGRSRFWRCHATAASDDLSEDAIVHGTMDTTARSTGADQLWRASGGGRRRRSRRAAALASR